MNLSLIVFKSRDFGLLGLMWDSKVIFSHRRAASTSPSAQQKCPACRFWLGRANRIFDLWNHARCDSCTRPSHDQLHNFPNAS